MVPKQEAFGVNPCCHQRGMFPTPVSEKLGLPYKSPGLSHPDLPGQSVGGGKRLFSTTAQGVPWIRQGWKSQGLRIKPCFEDS